MDDVLARYDTVIQEIDTQIKESENVWKKKEKIISEKHMKMFSFMRYLKNILYVRLLRI